MANAVMNLGVLPASVDSHVAASGSFPFRSTICTPSVSVLQFDRKPIAVRTMALAKDNEEERVAVEKRQNGTPTPSRSRSTRNIAPFKAFDLWDPFAPPSSSLVQMLNLMDDFLEDSSTVTSRSVSNNDRRTPWDVIEDGESFSLRIDMPGLTKKDVKIFVEDNSLVVKGGRQSEEKERDKWASRSYGKYSYKVALPEKIQTQQIKAELKDGVLYITVPKLRKEARVLDIQVS